MTVTIEQHGGLFSNQSRNKREYSPGARRFNQVIDSLSFRVNMNCFDRIAIARIDNMIRSELQRQIPFVRIRLAD